MAIFTKQQKDIIDEALTHYDEAIEQGNIDLNKNIKAEDVQSSIAYLHKYLTRLHSH